MHKVMIKYFWGKTSKLHVINSATAPTALRGPRQNAWLNQDQIIIIQQVCIGLSVQATVGDIFGWTGGGGRLQKLCETQNPLYRLLSATNHTLHV